MRISSIAVRSPHATDDARAVRRAILAVELGRDAA
jgi:hypothetical protein